MKIAFNLMVDFRARFNPILMFIFLSRHISRAFADL
jgi:hypothetical protein